MINTEWEDFWWNNITGANMIVIKVADVLFENKMVVLNVPSDLPWRYQMRSAIELRFRKNAETENTYMQIIDANDECQNEAPGKFLLTKFCKEREVKNGYREKSGLSIQQYLIKNHVLNNTIIWIKGLNQKQIKAWMSFCREYNSQSVTNGLFVLEVHDIKNVVINNRKAALINFNNFVSNYDVQLFDSFILDSENHYSTNWKRYISTVVACLCDTDAEISLELIKNTDFLLDNPVEGIAKIDKSGLYASRGGDEGSNHVLAHYRRNEDDELKHRVWSAQVQVLFPLIEMERVKLISTLYDEIKKALDYEDISRYGVILKDANEVELGTIEYLMKSSKINVPQANVRSWISFLRDCRNKIAHMECLESKDVAKLLNMVQRITDYYELHCTDHEDLYAERH